ncbi:Dockerin type I repeat protein [Rubripirellula amarantea]|uniref:Dockerin type I repeat protein n=1 Tax=Rubripirellula amarantea TaxID=2527999 RepID=A0A5C5WUT3_9BACT|nr:Ig-like domain-containing protein [Rubripirellula amarantea]TWT53763.1 Dockerin type I repeat protein [Rubripirellula amarantea]
MTKRTESNAQRSLRKPTERSHKRRLMMEDLESRQLMAVLTDVPDQPASSNLPVYSTPRNVGSVIAFNYVEVENQATLGSNDFRSTAEFIPFGTGSGKQDTVDISGRSPVTNVSTNNSGFQTDFDTYSFDLVAGDIIDIATSGAAGEFAIQGPYGPTGLPLPGQPALTTSFASSNLVGGLSSPLQTTGNASGTFVTPQDGRYFLTVAAATQTTSYTVGLRAYRPTTESLAYGDAQILYLDWEGGFVDNNLFLDPTTVGLPNFGITIVPTIEESLGVLGLEAGDVATANAVATGVYDEVVEIFEELTNNSANGDFEVTGNAGEYAIRILNSRDAAHRQWYELNANDPRITRMIIGGTGADTGLVGALGQVDFVDVGNFDLSQTALFALDGFVAATAGTVISPASSRLDLTTQFLASVAAHEAAHMFGMIHTNNTNTTLSLGDTGGGLTDAFAQGLGNDGIFGTLDDVQPIFRNDFYADPTIRAGFSRIRETLTHVLSTGTTGGTNVAGTVFGDLNRDGRNVGETGIPGITVFIDRDGDGVFDDNEVSTLTNSTGGFTLPVTAAGATIAIVTPDGTSATTATSVTVSGTNPQPISFGLSQSGTGSTNLGTVYVDSNGNDVADTGEGVADVFVFADLDGDGRPDLGEPNTRTNADGTYNLNFQGTGSFDIRLIVPAGYGFDTPSDGINTVVFDGTSVSGTGDFILRASRDFGDALESYGTLLADNGASHGIVEGLSIGTLPDRETNGQPSADASGDDTAGTDDEDGVRLLTPLGPGNLGTFEVIVNNTTGRPAYLQGFMDFNADGDFSDAGEQFAVNVSVASSTSSQTVSVPISVPANAAIGSTFARFRLSQTTGVGATGFAETGEVEDYTFPILTAAEIANDDEVSVSRNTLSNRLDILANDFDTTENPLRIESIDRTNLRGVVVIASDGKSIDYTPPNGFVGRDSFTYTVVDSFGTRSTAEVFVTVTFQSNVPIAVDDSFEVPEGSVNRALNVLDNDVASTQGGLIITSVTPGSAGANIQIIGGGQSLRYTPVPGFNGTEQFTYSIQDTAGQISTAEVTVNLLPGTRADDIVDFQIGVFDPVNINTPLTNVRVGDEFLVRVTVEDLRQLAAPEGVASAFLDLLYTDALVAVSNTGLNPSFPFDITFGPLFSGSENFLQRANADTPGLLDEVGGVQPITDQTEHTGPVELFTLRMVALSPGVAQFIGDPADADVSETVILASDDALLVNEQRYGRAELIILPASDNFTSAIDDSFPDGRDSDGNLIVNSAVNRNRLDVLGNDNLGPTGTIREFGLVTNPSFGTVIIEDNGTPDNLNDDYFSYRANGNANGLERFTYLIVTEDDVRSTAEVTIPLGNVNNNAVVAIDFALVNEAGTPITSVSVGDTFGVQVNVEDLRTFGSTFVFAGYLDVLYSSGLIMPVPGDSGSEFNFDVDFGAGYVADAGVGTAIRRGIIDEFGTLSSADTVDDGVNPALLATLYFEAIASGTATVVGSPADSSPFQDTLLFGEDEPIEVSQIRYDKLSITIGGGSGEGEAVQNPVLAPDVNNDGSVSPIDALLIINEMSRLPAEGEAGSSTRSSYFTDVNGDRRTSAIDALQVINYLTRMNNSRESEGEAIVAPLAASTSTDLGSTVASDSIFTDLSQSDQVLSTDSPSVAASLGPVVASTDSSISDDDETDILDLLADDVQGLWN